MTRSDLVNRLAQRFSQLTQRDTEFAVKTMLDAMSDALARGLTARPVEAPEREALFVREQPAQEHAP